MDISKEGIRCLISGTKISIKNVFDEMRIRPYLNTNLEMSRKKFDLIKDEVLSYVNDLRVSDTEYIFSKSVTTPTIYASTYACLILGMYGQVKDEDKEKWKHYFDFHQNNDGFFYDVNIESKIFHDGEGWGERHLVPHVLIAYERLGMTPGKRLSFLDKYCDEIFMNQWLENLDFTHPWGTSNKIMNLLCSLQYARDRMGEETQPAIEQIEKFLMQKIRKEYPFWLEGNIDNRSNVYQAIRGAYHIYPELMFDGIEFEHIKKLINLIIKIQNKMGGFDRSVISTACDDIDSIDPLIRFVLFYNIHNNNIDKCLYRAYCYIMSNRNPDGGFCFSRVKNGFMYGDCKQLSSKENQSNLFGTWFRLVCLHEIFHYFNIVNFNGVNISGYEQTLPGSKNV